MHHRIISLAVGLVLSLGSSRVSAGSESRQADAKATSISVLILAGSNNHDWKRTTPVLKKILESSGEFKVEVTEKPETLSAESLAGHDVLLSNWNEFGGEKPPEWPDQLRKAYVDFVRKGGGHVVVHAGSSSHYQWDEYQQICLATWVQGRTGHKEIHEFEVRMTGVEHPVTKGLGPFKTTDELWYLPGVRPEATVLAESFSKTTGKWEPTALAAEIGKGRCFTLLLGHDTAGMEAEGFRKLLRRGAAWAARAD
jgi:type 1 glutamine amidotransferase